VPLFMAHGLGDPVIPYAFSRRSGDLLADLGYALEWHDYPMDHALCLEEVRHIEDWLARVLA
ncbi:MAG TPA: carboxylesterase, partial [Rhodocyclaceae bacterium]|nr:carboxylesterase [Rhodocyclaceae bacterium]